MAETAAGEQLRLSRADRLIISRRRAGKSQAEAAAERRVAYHVYSRWETGADDETCPDVSVGRLAGHERALVYRRHARRTQRAVAAELGVCVYTLRRMEQGVSDPTALLEYWEC